MKKKTRLSWLSLLGILLLLGGLAGLYSGPEISQYAFAPTELRADKALEKMGESLQDAYAALALHGSSHGVSLETEKKSQGDITLYQVAGEWNSVYPQVMTAGRPVNPQDQRSGQRVIVLDAETAFQLFGDQDPLGQQVKLGGKTFEVVGVAAHRRRIGETDPHCAWIPFGLPDAPPCDIFVFSAGGASGAALRTMFENAARETLGDGQAIHLGKEKNRGTIMPRVVLLVLGLRLLAAWIRLARRKSGQWIAEIRDRAKTRYPRQMIGFTLLRGAGMLGAFGLAVAAGAGLAVMAAAPMRVFPEWVPEVLVDPESLRQRFWNLTALAAAPRQWRTPELAEIRFWSGMIRWGILLALLGRIKGKKARPEPVEKPADPAF